MSFTKSKKHIFLLLVSAFLLLLAAGCQSSTTPENEGASDDNQTAVDDEPITLEYWTINLRAGFEDYIQGMIDDYEDDNPNITIDWVDVPGDEVIQKFISSLSTDDVPDLANYPSFEITNLPDGTFYPISDLLSEDELDHFLPNMLDSVTYSDQVMAFPWYTSGPPVGILNEVFYREAGLDPDNPPQTWDEVLEYGKVIHEQLPDIYGSNDFPTIEILRSSGVKLLSDDGREAIFNTPEAVAFIEKFVEGYEHGAIAPGTLEKESGVGANAISTYQQTIANGLIAQNGFYKATSLTSIEQNAPQRMEDLKVFPSVTDSGELALEGFQSFVIPQKSKHPEEAADFGLFVTNATNQLEFTKLAPIYPTTSATLEDPFFSEIEGDSVEENARKIMVDNITDLTILNVNIDLRSAYRKEVIAAFFGKKSVEQALDDAAAAWNSKLSD